MEAREAKWIYFRMPFVDILVPLQNSLDPSFPHYSLFQSSKAKLLLNIIIFELELELEVLRWN